MPPVPRRAEPFARTTLAAGSGLLGSAGAAAAQTVSLDLGAAGGPAEAALRVVALATALALAPSLLVLATSFTRIVVVLSFLRSGIGAQGAPPNAVVIGLALALTGYVMEPTLGRAWRDGLQPWLGGKVEASVGIERAVEPLRGFMLANLREKDLALFVDLAASGTAGGNLAGAKRPETPAAVPLTTLVPAFVISELRRAFEIGFMLLLPFVVIDLAVAVVLTAMGLMMTPPGSIALPVKLAFFVLVDGWSLVVGSLARSYGL